jgi:hypothetical protein
MVLPSERAVLTRTGPFFLTAASFLEANIGYGAQYLVGFGFPNERAMRVAERLGLYAEVGRMVEVCWPPLSTPLSTQLVLGPCVHHLDPEKADLHGRLVDRLWMRMRHDLRDGIVGVRDWSYVRHRYLRHPHKRYNVLLMKSRFIGRALGIVALNRGGESCELVDIIAPLKHLPLLVNQTRRMAALWGMNGVYCWITKSYAELFTNTGGKSIDLDIRIPTSAWTPGPRPEDISGRWWLMSGDTDFH